MDPDKPAEATGGQDIPEKTPEAVTENPPPIDPPDYKYEEINKQEMSEIARSEPPKGNESETIKEEPVKEPEINAEEIAKKAAEEALAQQEAKRLAEEAAKPKEVPPVPTEADKLEKFRADFVTNKGREPTWVELAVYIKEDNKAETKAELIAEQQAAYREYQQEQQALKEAKEAEDKQVNAFVDDGLQELYANNKLTKIVDPNNPLDPGVIEKKSLFAKWAEVNMERKAKGLPEIFDVTRVANYHWTKPNTQPAGADAPVQGSRSSATAGDDGSQYTNADLKKPWGWFKRSYQPQRKQQLPPLQNIYWVCYTIHS